MNSKYEHIGSREDHLIEEMAELTKAICKAKRFGWNNQWPDKKSKTNEEKVVAEALDVQKRLKELLESIT